MIRIKICGLRTLDDAVAAAQAGADMLGFHLSRHSPYMIERDEAIWLCAALRQQLGSSCPVLVGVFSNELVSNISAATGKIGLDAAQLSGAESDAMFKELRGIAFKSVQPFNTAMALEDVEYYRPHFPANQMMPSLMLDPFFEGLKGGAKASAEMVRAIQADVPRLMLTGGFTPDNVQERIQAFRPWGVDVLEGVDKKGKPGVKDRGKMKAFVDSVEG